MSVVVDTTPDARSGMGTPPAFPGRTISLQQRVDGDRWSTIDTGTTDADGLATFEVEAPDAGAIVLRARQERWTADGNAIGWFPSFPTYFTVDADRGRAVALPASPTLPRPTRTATRKDPRRPTASQTWGWGPSLWDYDWGFGEDFDSDAVPRHLAGRHVGRHLGRHRPGRPVQRRARAPEQARTHRSGRPRHDDGDPPGRLADARGRWEFRLQGHAWEKGPRPYRFLLELVPQDAPDVTCQSASIVVADVVMGKKGVGFGVRSSKAGSTWTGKDKKARLAEAPINMAVEVGKKHITWFRDGKPIASVNDKRAQLRAPLVPRFSLVGGQQEMNGAQVDSDWQRAFSLDRGEQVVSKHQLASAPYSPSC